MARAADWHFGQTINVPWTGKTTESERDEKKNQLYAGLHRVFNRNACRWNKRKNQPIMAGEGFRFGNKDSSEATPGAILAIPTDFSLADARVPKRSVTAGRVSANSCDGSASAAEPPVGLLEGRWTADAIIR
jgi:hypothetical protein